MHFLPVLLIWIIVAQLGALTYLFTESAVTPGTAPRQTTTADHLLPAPDQPSLFTLPSKIGQRIPDILLKSAAYQQATVAAIPERSEATTDEPLEALVNVFCTIRTDEYIRTTTGTGFFIDPDGVVMTNAHIAQFLLLEDTDSFGEANCILRSGDPAAPRYEAELLYLPPAWVLENAGVFYEEVPMGTGERDYALLYVANTIDDTTMPERFPTLAFDTSLLPVSTKNDPVLAAGYPAANLASEGSDALLRPQKASTTVSELYTFGSNYADVFSIRGSVVGAEGASGGPILNDSGEVIGLIVTRGDDSIDGAGSLRAITLSHIARTIEEESGFSLEQSLAGDLPNRSTIFTDTLSPFLLSLLEAKRPE